MKTMKTYSIWKKKKKKKKKTREMNEINRAKQDLYISAEKRVTIVILMPLRMGLESGNFHRRKSFLLINQ